MTINWFAALPPADTASAGLTKQIIPVLAKQAEVVIWSHRPGWDAAIEAHAKVRSYDLSKPPWREFNRADITFFHLENEVDWSGPLWTISRRYPGIVILHDLNLQEFFITLALQDLSLSLPQYLALAEFHYPGIGRVLGEMYFRREITVEELAARCPLAGAVAGSALAVIVHSSEALELLSREAACPVLLIPPPHSSSATAYVAALMNAAENVADYEAIWSARIMSRRAGEAIAPWCSKPEVSDLPSRLAEQIKALNFFHD